MRLALTRLPPFSRLLFSQKHTLAIPAFKPRLEQAPLPDLPPTPNLPPPPSPINAAASSSKRSPPSRPPTQGLPPPPTFSKPSSTLKPKPDALPLLALPVPARPLLPISSSSFHKTNSAALSFSFLDPNRSLMPPPPLPLPKKTEDNQPSNSSSSSKKRSKDEEEQLRPEKPTTTTTKRARHLGLGAGMSRLSKVPSLLSSIRGVQLVGLGGGGGDGKGERERGREGS